MHDIDPEKILRFTSIYCKMTYESIYTLYIVANRKLQQTNKTLMNKLF